MLRRQTAILFCLLLLLGAMFAAPQEVVAGASAGLSLWALCIVPALLPFFIVSDLLVEHGAVDFLGALCEPLMRPLFKLPGCAAFVLAIVHTAGMPIGATLTSRLRESGELSRIEGERLLAFTCNPSPGFMFGAVAGGMLGVPALGAVLAGSVYVANLIVGLVFRFYGSLGGNNSQGVNSGDRSGGKAPFSHAAQKLRTAQENRRPFGLALAESTRKNVLTLLQIGGYIVFFSVLVRLLQHWPLLTIISKILALLVSAFPFPGFSPTYELTQETETLLTGIIEQTLGCRAVADTIPTLSSQTGLIAFLMGCGGLCVCAQIAGIISKTDLRLKPFLCARLLHGTLALLLSQLALRHMPLSVAALPVSVPYNTLSYYMEQGWGILKWNALFFGAFLLLIFLISRRLLRRTRT